jgi:hypothetical protein
MPVNMDPKKRRKKPSQADAHDRSREKDGVKGVSGEETEADREKALADAEWKNLWDATEVIDMDRW